MMEASLPVRLVLNDEMLTGSPGHTVRLVTGFTLGIGLTLILKVTGVDSQMPIFPLTVTIACLFVVVLLSVVVKEGNSAPGPVKSTKSFATEGSLTNHV